MADYEKYCGEIEDGSKIDDMDYEIIREMMVGKDREGTLEKLKGYISFPEAEVLKAKENKKK